MSSREDYEWRRKISLHDFGCLGLIGLGVITCTGVVRSIDWGRFSVDEQVGKNLYVFVCHEEDRVNRSCETKEHLWAVYENTTTREWAHAPVSWISDTTDTERCSYSSYNLGQCYDLSPKREAFYQKYLEDKVKEKQ